MVIYWAHAPDLGSSLALTGNANYHIVFTTSVEKPKYNK